MTIKGTERSVSTAREMIEEALSTSTRDSDEVTLPSVPSSAPPLASPLIQNPVPPPLQSAPPLLATPPQIAPVSHAPAMSVSSNPWGQPPLPPSSSSSSGTGAVTPATTTSTGTSNVWGQKRYSDVVPPSSSSLQQQQSGSSSSDSKDTQSPPLSAPVGARKFSLPANVPSSSVPAATSSVAPIATTTTSQSKSVVSVSKETPPTEPVTMVTRTGSIPATLLSIVQEEEEETEEMLKHKRSNSEPMNSSSSSTNLPSGDPVGVASSAKTAPLQSSQKFSPSMSPILSPSTPTSPPIPLIKASTSSAGPLPPELPQSPELKVVSTATTVPPASSVSVGVTKASRMVGVVTPTQTVKPYQVRDTLMFIFLFVFFSTKPHPPRCRLRRPQSPSLPLPLPLPLRPPVVMATLERLVHLTDEAVYQFHLT